DLREQLAEAGAGQATLDHVGEALDPQTTGDARVAGEVQTDGRVLVANDSGVVLDEPWDAALGAGDSAQWSAAPDLGPLLREQAQSVRLLVAITDKQGATVQRVVAAPAHDLEQGNEDAVDGTGHGSGHQPRRGALSHKQIQRHAQEVVQQNQRDIADHLARVATRWHPERIVLGARWRRARPCARNCRTRCRTATWSSRPAVWTTSEPKRYSPTTYATWPRRSARNAHSRPLNTSRWPRLTVRPSPGPRR